MSIDPYLDITIDAMSTALHHTPRGFQCDVIPYILRMKGSLQNPIHPVLLVQGTGGGKSSVYQTIGIIKQGVSLIIENTLSLSSDQLSKIKLISQRIPNVHCFQLDSIKTDTARSSLATEITKLHSKSNTTIFLFSSPESLLKEPWTNLLSNLIKNEVLKQICVDEVHLFIMFAITFRHSFLKLRSLLFNQVKVHNPQQHHNQISTHSNIPTCKFKVPIIFMTATFNPRLLFYLERIVGFTIPTPSKFWCDGSTFARRNISINITSSVYKMKIIKTNLHNTLHDNLYKKAIVYCNTASAVEKIRDDLDNWLNEANTGIEGDTIIINGDLESEWKFFSSQKFTETNTNPQTEISNNMYYPRILVATSGCIGAGLDSSSVHCVIRDGFPSSILDFIQEMGRCGRSRDSTAIDINTDSFDINVQLSSFVYMMERIYSSKKKLKVEDKQLLEEVISVEDVYKFQASNLLEVAKLVYLDSTSCWHYRLEQCCLFSNSDEQPNISGNSRNNTNQSDTCHNACPACSKTYTTYIKPVSRIGLTRFIVSTFILTQSGVITPSILVQKLNKFKDVGIIVYNKRVGTSPITQILTSTIMQLIASQLLAIKIDTVDDIDICTLTLNVINEFGRLSYEEDSYWNGMWLV